MNFRNSIDEKMNFQIYAEKIQKIKGGLLCLQERMLLRCLKRIKQK